MSVSELINMGMFIHSGLKYLCKILNQIKKNSEEIDRNSIIFNLETLGTYDNTKIAKYETILELEASIDVFIDEMALLNIFIQIEDTNVIIKNKHKDTLLVVDFTKLSK
jgi:hypothetical protein